MKKRFSILLLLSINVLVALPQLHVEQTHQYVGEVLWHEPCTAVYTLVNRGTSTVHISELRASCGCVEPKISAHAITPGSSATLSLTYDAGNLGTFHKEAAVYIAGTEMPLWLSMEGRVVRERLDVGNDFPVNFGRVRLSTDNIEFEHVNKGDMPVAEISIVNAEHGNYVPSIMHLPPYLEAEFIPEVLHVGQKGIIRLRLNSEMLPDYGLNQVSVYLARHENDRVSEDNAISISAVKLPSFAHLTESQLQQAPCLQLSADEVVMKGMAKGKKINAVVLVSNVGQTPLSVKHLQVSDRAVGVSLANRTIAPGKSVKLKITLSPSALKSVKVRPRVLIISDDPKHSAQFINIIPK